MSRMREIAIVPDRRAYSPLAVLFLGAAALLVGCDGDGGGAGPCADIADPCLRQGETRCATSAAVQRCDRTDEGCLVWTRADSCEGLRQCEATGAGHECVCDDECSSLGPVGCDGDTIVGCIEDADGCLIYSQTRDCAAEDLVCDAAEGPPDCVQFCVDRCDAEGESECQGSTVLSCIMGPHGCRVFRLLEDCAADGLECDDSTGAAVCVEP